MEVTPGITPLFQGAYIVKIDLNGEAILSHDPPSVLRTEVICHVPAFNLPEISAPDVFKMLKEYFAGMKSQFLKINQLNADEVGLWLIAENNHLMCYRAPKDMWAELLRLAKED